MHWLCSLMTIELLDIKMDDESRILTDFTRHLGTQQRYGN